MPDTIYYNLQRASRTHRQLTWQETRTKNIITFVLDKTFTGLWNPEDSIPRVREDRLLRQMGKSVSAFR